MNKQDKKLLISKNQQGVAQSYLVSYNLTKLNFRGEILLCRYDE